MAYADAVREEVAGGAVEHGGGVVDRGIDKAVIGVRIPPAQHDAGVRAVVDRRLDVRAHVVGADVDLGVGRVAHRVEVDVPVDPVS